MEELAARTVLPDLPVQLFIILPRIPYLSATIIAIRDLPEFFRVCKIHIQIFQFLRRQFSDPVISADQIHAKSGIPVIFFHHFPDKVGKIPDALLIQEIFKMDNRDPFP